MKAWKLITWECCPDCGRSLEVFTAADGEEMCYDADDVRCTACEFRSATSVDEDGNAWIQEA